MNKLKKLKNHIKKTGKKEASTDWCDSDVVLQSLNQERIHHQFLLINSCRWLLCCLLSRETNFFASSFPSFSCFLVQREREVRERKRMGDVEGWINKRSWFFRQWLSFLLHTKRKCKKGLKRK